MHVNCFREMCIPQHLDDQYQTGEAANLLTSLSRVNAFIGPNNSGKSRLLRGLFASPKPLYGTGHPLEARSRDALRTARRIISTLPPQFAVSNRLRERIAHCTPLLRSNAGDYSSQSTADAPIFSSMANDIGSSLKSQLSPDDCRELAEALQRLASTHTHIQSEKPPEISPVSFYIPTLRGLRPSKLHPGYYADRTVADYFESHGSIVPISPKNPSEPHRHQVITGHELYELVQRHLLGTHSERVMIRDYESFLSRHFFDKSSVTILPMIDKDVLYVKIGNAADRPIYDLGDGLQQIIIQTLPLYIFRDKPLRLYIEEPELYLHPGFQRILINAFLEDLDRDLQVFVATHSNHFMDITLDTEQCAVFKVAKLLNDPQDSQEQFSVRKASSSDFETLRLLGIRNSSVLLSNCTIWVEGITDRLYLRRFVEVLLKEMGLADKYVEDLHFSFVEYSGGNICHWSFLDVEDGIDASRVCSPLMLIADLDSTEERPSGAKALRADRLNEVLAERFVQLKSREIENLLHPKVIALTLKDYGEIDENLAHPYPGWSEYRVERLGTFIDEKFLLDKKQSHRRWKKYGPYSAEFGTIKDKPGFCRFAITHIRSVEDLTEEAREVATRIIDFIRRHN